MSRAFDTTKRKLQMQGCIARGAPSPLVDAENWQISTFVIIFRNILCKNSPCYFDNAALMNALGMYSD